MPRGRKLLYTGVFLNNESAIPVGLQYGKHHIEVTFPRPVEILHRLPEYLVQLVLGRLFVIISPEFLGQPFYFVLQIRIKLVPLGSILFKYELLELLLPFRNLSLVAYPEGTSQGTPLYITRLAPPDGGYPCLIGGIYQTVS